jgi:predicted ribosomally synthesized peptide with SipW-like signal peptide
MSDETIEINRRRVLGGIVAIGGAAAAAGAGTSAYFFDETSSTGNTIEAGELNLGDLSEDTFTLGPLYPGSDDSLQVTSGYSGNTSNVVLDVGFAVANDANGLASALQIQEASISAGGTTESVSTGSLADVTGAYPDVLSLSGGETITLSLDVLLPETDTNQNDLENASLDFGFALKARQDTAPALQESDVSATSS